MTRWSFLDPLPTFKKEWQIMWIWWSFENIKNNKLYQTIFFVEVGGWEDKLEISLTQQSWGLSVAWAELGKIPLFIYVNIWKMLVIMCVWIIYSLSCNLQIISDQVLGLSSWEIIAAYISERMTCALYHPPSSLLCHPFKTKRKEDLLLPPTYLKGQCHSIRRFFFDGVP